MRNQGDRVQETMGDHCTCQITRLLPDRQVVAPPLAALSDRSGDKSYYVLMDYQITEHMSNH